MRLTLVALLLLSSCGGGTSTTAEPDEPTGGGGAEVGGSGIDSVSPARRQRVTGRNFSIPLPLGYRHVVSGTIADMMREDVLTPGGVILMAEATSPSGPAPGSIVVSPTAADISSDAVDDNLCGQLAELVARQHQATVERTAMVELPFGRACQWTLRVGSEESRLRLGTVFAAHAEDWIVTCNYDERDEEASAACSEVLGGWAFAD